MISQPSVVVVGHVCVDEIVTETRTERTVGSPAAFIAPVLRDSGIDTTVAAPHGSDFDALGSGLRMLDPAHGDRTLLFVNDVRSSRRTQAVRHPELAALGRPTPAVLEALRGADALLLTPLLPDPPVAIVREHVAALPTSALRLVLLQGYLRRIDGRPDARGDHEEHAVLERTFTEADELLPLFDVAVLSDEDLPHDVDATVLDWSITHPETAVVVTRGADGASVYRAGSRRDQPAHPVGALPTDALVGAGDTFAAELTAALLSAAGGARAAAADLDTLDRAVARANRETAGRLARQLSLS